MKIITASILFASFLLQWPGTSFTCRKCGKVNPPNYMICDHCGTPRID